MRRRGRIARNISAKTPTDSVNAFEATPTIKLKPGITKGNVTYEIGNESTALKDDAETHHVKRNRSINVIKSNSGVTNHSDSSATSQDQAASQDPRSLIDDKLIPNSLVAAFSKPNCTHVQEGAIASETSVMHSESCLVNEAGKNALLISGYTDHVTRFCKLSPVPERRSAVASDLLIENEEAQTDENEQSTKIKMKTEENNKMTTTQRQTPVKSVSAVDASLQPREINKKNIGLKRGRRINTLNFPGDNFNARIEARKVPLRRPRRRRVSSSSLSSDGDADLSPVREKNDIEHPTKLITSNLADEILVNKIGRSPSRVRARHRTRGSSNASDCSNSNDRQNQTELTGEKCREERGLLRSELGSREEGLNDVKCYSMTGSVETTKSQQPLKTYVDEKYATLPAKYHSADSMPSSVIKQSKVNRASSQEAVTLTRKGDQIKSLDDNKLMIENKQTTQMNDTADKNIDVEKHNSGFHSSAALRLSSNQSAEPVSRTGKIGTKINNSEAKTLPLEPKRRAVSELTSFYNSESLTRSTDVHKRRQNFMHNSFKNVDVSESDGFKQNRQGQSLKAKKVGVSYWPNTEQTKTLLNLDFAAKKFENDMNSSANGGNGQENLENEYLQHLSKETNLSDPVNETNSELAVPVPPRRHKQKRNLQPEDPSLLNHQAALGKHDTAHKQKKNTTSESDINHNQISSENDKISPSYNESRVFTTSSISTRKSSLVSQSTALPRHRHMPSRDSEESAEVDEGFTEEMLDTSQNFRDDAIPFPSREWRRSSHRNEKSKPRSSQPSRSLSDPLANFSKLKVHSEQESFEDNSSEFPLKPHEQKSDNERNSDSDLSECSDSSSSEDIGPRTITQTFGSDSSFKILRKKNSINDLDAKLRNFENDSSPSYNSYRRSKIETTSDIEKSTDRIFISGSHSLPKSTKTFQAKERKFVDDENFKNSEENLFQPIKQERSFDSLSPSDNSDSSSMEDSLEQEEKEFDKMVETMSKIQEDRNHHSRPGDRKPRETFQHSRLSRISERSRRRGVSKSFEANEDMSSDKTYGGYNDFRKDQKKTVSFQKTVTI